MLSRFAGKLPASHLKVKWFFEHHFFPDVEVQSQKLNLGVFIKNAIFIIQTLILGVLCMPLLIEFQYDSHLEVKKPHLNSVNAWWWCPSSWIYQNERDTVDTLR